MLIPRRVKHRKQHHPDRSGAAKGGTAVTFGEWGIQALEPAYVTNRQIESARIAITRHIRRGGKVWINIYPDRPADEEAAETRMGSGKGSPEWWVANVKPGRVMFELSYPSERSHGGADPAIHKLPMKCRIVSVRAVSSDGVGSKTSPENSGLRRRALVEELASQGGAVQPRFPRPRAAGEPRRLAAVTSGHRTDLHVMRERELGITPAHQ
jgi:large subunit ribosomal protein L16